MEAGVDGGRRARGRPLGRSHTLDAAERTTGLTGGTGAPPSASHAGSASADQSHLDLNGDLEPRPHTAQTDGGPPAGPCS